MRRILVLVLLSLLGLSVPGSHHAQAAELRDLRSLDELRALVDHDKTVPRVVLLLSPT
jgi:hypothetical protein